MTPSFSDAKARARVQFRDPKSRNLRRGRIFLVPRRLDGSGGVDLGRKAVVITEAGHHINVPLCDVQLVAEEAA